MPYHNFEEDLINELPSCIYAGQHQAGVNTAGGAPGGISGGGGGGGNGGAGGAAPGAGLRLSSNNLRHIQQHYMQHNNGKMS